MRTILAISLFALIVGAGCSSGDVASEPTDPPGDLAMRTIVAGAVTVDIDPVRIDEDGAVFDIALETHSVELEMDLAHVASLTVDGKEWGQATWDGDPPSGHHREGSLSFEPAGSARGAARLVLGGFSEPVEAQWRIEDA
jgi:hypothetical protein